MQVIEHELEVTVRVHEVRSEYERQMEEYVFFILLLVHKFFLNFSISNADKFEETRLTV